MKTIKCIIPMMIVLLFLSCKNSIEVGESLSDGQITNNLIKNGDNKPELLIGKWDCIRFAYTADGNKIINVADGDLSFYDINSRPYYSYFDIIDFDLVNEQGVNGWMFYCLAEFRVDYSIFPENLIKLSLYQISFNYVNSPQNDAIVSALNSVYSFVIKDDELIFYFTGVDKKNLLIFKKRK